ncbi:methyltransferase domain-containing protein [Allomuricauda sp. SCSIO 65647]|uniref:methyltransferase domain-containing protein n=1 Tax=Allomuricauda sp. SCSIO 65647 TaxID=2908843 RepID=UPI001F3811D6|nr:methyltransferase domain-containing protein [Muricauda sp. SCSIO 65647]UJH67398.1 methyltransferase domain-containing protein [Muricauda sp. SCSIO 65647]
MDLALRSHETEWMDAPDLELFTLEKVFRDINRANAWLGGNRITIKAVHELIKTVQKKSYTILDLGCGDGQMLRELAISLRKKGIQAKLIGLELREDVAMIARSSSRDFPEIEYVQGDILHLNDEKHACDIVLCTLTLHHFGDERLPGLLNNFSRLAKIGVVINDLHRHRFAYYLFMLFGFLFLKTAIARNDGLVSIRRGFKKAELDALSEQVTNANHTIKWQWAFRFVWTLRTKRPI